MYVCMYICTHVRSRCKVSVTLGCVRGVAMHEVWITTTVAFEGCRLAVLRTLGTVLDS